MEMANYIFGNPSPDEMERIMNHCHECETCREAVYFLLINKKDILMMGGKGEISCLN
jgi:hypothetical protein